MTFPVKLVFPLADGKNLTKAVQTPRGAEIVDKEISARDADELERLERIGWKVKA